MIIDFEKEKAYLEAFGMILETQFQPKMFTDALGKLAPEVLQEKGLKEKVDSTLKEVWPRRFRESTFKKAIESI